MPTQEVRVDGMTCEHCERAVMAEVSALESVTSVEIELRPGDQSIVRIASDTALDVQDIAAAIEEAGYQVVDS